MTKEKTAKRDSTQRKNEKRNDKIENNETPIKAICNKGFSGKSIVLPRSNFGVGGQDSSPQSLTAHSLNRSNYIFIFDLCYAVVNFAI